MADFYNSSSSGGFYGNQNFQNEQHQQQSQQPKQSNSNSAFYTENVNANSNSGYASSSSQPSMFHPTTTSTSNGLTTGSTGQVSQKPVTASIFNPVTAAAMAAAATSGNNAAMFGLAEQAGKNFLEGGTARLVPGLELFMQTLRPYFAVDNSYVRKKMTRVLFSFRYKEWKRFERDPMGSSNLEKKVYEPPVSDPNSLDLYIPCMSLITYVLLCALCYGTAGKFDPGVLSNVMTTCLVMQVLEVMGFKCGLYMMNVSDLSFFDLFALTGYKYLSLCINMLIGLFLEYIVLGTSGTKGYYISFIYTASSTSWFVLRTTANNIPLITSAAGPKREIVVLLFGVSQFATMWFVSQTKYLN